MNRWEDCDVQKLGGSDTHLQSDRQHTNRADEQRHKGEPNPVEWLRRCCDERKENLRKGDADGWVEGVGKRGQACKESVTPHLPNPHLAGKRSKGVNVARFLDCSVSLHP